MTDELPDLSESYDQEHPPPKRGRPASTFPSGKTVQEVADAMPCCSTLIGKWCLGLRVPRNRVLRFFELAGFKDSGEWQHWKDSRKDAENDKTTVK